MSFERHLNFLVDKTRRPNREQHLLVSRSKHWYALKDGQLRYQKSPLHPKTAGAKQLLVFFVAFDADTGVFYAEPHEDKQPYDVLGFLARAWHKKKDHVMWGIPDKLNISSEIRENESTQNDLRTIQSHLNVVLGNLPGGFRAGVHAVRLLGNEFRCLSDVPGKRGLDLFAAQALSSLISARGSLDGSQYWSREGIDIREAPTEWFSFVDQQYQDHGAWRTAPFDLALYGTRSER